MFDYPNTPAVNDTVVLPNGAVSKWDGVKWTGVSGGSAVSSVYGRTGAVVATAGDYTATQITVSPTVVGASNVQAALTTVAANAAPASPLNSVQWNNAGAFGGSANLFWDNANSRLGIGTNTPAVLLDLKGNNTPYGGQIRIQSADYGQITFYNSANPALGTGNELAGLYFDVVGGKFTLQNFSGAPAYGPILLNPGGGNVGIGNSGAGPFTAAGYSQLTVGPQAVSSQCGIITACGDASAANTQMAGFNGANFNLSYSDKRIASINISTDTSADTGMINFWTYAAGTPSERMRITSGGNVGIGTTSPQSILHCRAATDQNLQIGGMAWALAGSVGFNASNDANNANIPMTYSASYHYFRGPVRVGANANATGAGDLGVARDSAPTTGAVFFGNSGSVYIVYDGTKFVFAPASTNLPSDVRLKQNIRPLTGGIAIINQLRPIEAEWSPLAKVNVGKRLVSILAQELQTILPGAVEPYRGPNSGDPELLSYNPTEILLQAVLAIQQMDRRLKALEKE